MSHIISEDAIEHLAIEPLEAEGDSCLRPTIAPDGEVWTGPTAVLVQQQTLT